MSNDFFNASGSPSLASSGSSTVIRAEFDGVEDGFDKLPVVTANANKPVVVNSGATALTVLSSTVALAGNFALTGSYAITLVAGGSVTTTLPGVSGTLFTIDGSVTLTNKTFVSPALGTVTGTYTIGGTPTYPSGTTLSSPVFTGNITGTYTIGGTPTFTSPTVAASTFTSPVFKKITVSSGPLTLTSGQIKFPSAPGIPAAGTSNSLYDYEEGTWTPTLTAGSGVGDLSVTYTTQIGTYTKIGNFVVLHFVIVTSAFTHTTAAGAIGVGGLPFTDAYPDGYGMKAAYARGRAAFKGTTTTGRHDAFTTDMNGFSNNAGYLMFTWQQDSNNGLSYLQYSDHTSGTNVTIQGTAYYIAKFGN